MISLLRHPVVLSTKIRFESLLGATCAKTHLFVSSPVGLCSRPVLMGIPSGLLPFLSAQLVKPSTRPLFGLDWKLTFTTDNWVQCLPAFIVLATANTTLRYSSSHLATTPDTDSKPFTLLVIAALVFGQYVLGLHNPIPWLFPGQLAPPPLRHISVRLSFFKGRYTRKSEIL